MNQYAVGVDIGGTRTKVGLVDLESGTVAQRVILPTETKNESRFLSNLHAAIDRLRLFSDSSGGRLQGIGIGIPGFVMAQGQVDSTYGFLEFMEDYPLGKMMTERHLVPCLLDNDARVVALGEALYGKGKAYERVLVLTLGTGLGIGVVNNGKLNESLPYAHMAGHMKVTSNTVKCYCGKYGCLESLVSATALCLAAGKKWEEINRQPLTAENIFKARETGDLLSICLIDELIGWLRDGIDNFVNTYAPDVIILGGGMSRGLMNDLDKLHDPGLLNSYKSYSTVLAVSELNEDAGILGSAALFKKPIEN